MKHLIYFIAMVGVAFLSACSLYPTDREMIEMLRDHEKEFNQIVGMVKEDSYLWEVNREHERWPRCFGVYGR
ncbi:hypothetical protein BH20ACI2_BH20ACI2_07080 [soil metagenome]